MDSDGFVLWFNDIQLYCAICLILLDFILSFLLFHFCTHYLLFAFFASILHLPPYLHSRLLFSTIYTYYNSRINWHLCRPKLRWRNDQLITPQHTKNAKNVVGSGVGGVWGLIIITPSEIISIEKVPIYPAVVIKRFAYRST